MQKKSDMKKECRKAHRTFEHIQQCPKFKEIIFINQLMSRDEQICHYLDNDVWNHILGKEVLRYLQKKAQNRNEV